MIDETTEALVRHRLDQAATALDDARYLQAGGRSPQGVVNRAYYAMFYAGLALLQRRGRTPTKHTGVLGLFDTEFVARGTLSKDLSKSFHRTYRLRQDSDYQHLHPATREQAQELIDEAARFVAAIHSYLDTAED